MTRDIASVQRGEPRFVTVNRAAYLARLLCGAALTLSAGFAAAQPAGSSHPAPVDIGEVVVTARHRDEALTKVPAAITAYSSDYIAKQNIQTFTDYATKVPNLSFQYGQGGTALWSGDRQTTIRGVVGDGTTAYYIDDTPVPGSVSPQVLNLDHIEVLKGPQGTLYGASSMGGNVRFITKKPSLSHEEGEVHLEAGGTKSGGLDLDANVQRNFVLAPERVALDAALGYTRESGFITRRFPGPSGQLISKDGEGRTDTISGSLSFRAKLTDALEARISVLGQSARLHGFPGAYVPLPDYKPLSYTIDREKDIQEYSKDDWGLGSVVLNYAGDGLSVVSSTSVFGRNIEQLDDNTEASNYFFKNLVGLDLGNPTFYYTSFSTERRITEETRLSFDDGKIIPGLSGVFGVFYEHIRVKRFNPGIFVQELSEAGFVYPYVADVRTNTSEEDKALFGEIYYKILPRLTITAGLRKYWLSQTTDPSTLTGVAFGATGVQNVPEISSRESGLIPKAVISYEIGDRGNIYASVSKGFRPGGDQTPLPDFCSADLAQAGLTAADVGQYRSDTLWSYEVGAKSRLASGRLTASAAAFRMDWSGIQQTAVLPVCGLTFISNAGAARLTGGEFELSGQPFDAVPLTIQFGLGYIDAVLVDPGRLPLAPNSRLGMVPKWTGSVSAYYEYPIKNDMSLFAAGDYSYTSSSKVPKAADQPDQFLTRAPLNFLNANFGLNFGPSQIMFYGKNLLDERLNLGDQPASGFERRQLLPDGSFQRLPRADVSRPRQFGVQYHLSF